MLGQAACVYFPSDGGVSDAVREATIYSLEAIKIGGHDRFAKESVGPGFASRQGRTFGIFCLSGSAPFETWEMIYPSRIMHPQISPQRPRSLANVRIQGNNTHSTSHCRARKTARGPGRHCNLLVIVRQRRLFRNGGN